MDIDWKTFICTDSGKLPGKAVITGTQLSIEFILDLLAEGWTEEQVIAHYPVLTREIMHAVFAFIKESLAKISPQSSQRVYFLSVLPEDTKEIFS